MISEMLYAVGGVISGFLVSIFANHIYYRRQKRELQEKFSWENIHTACRALKRELDNFEPDIIVTSSGAPSVVAGLVVEERMHWTPVVTIFVTAPDVQGSPKSTDPRKFDTFVHEDKTWHVPSALFENPQKRVAVIDDCCIADTSYFSGLRKCLCEKGFQNGNIFTACLIASPRNAERKSIVNWCFFKPSSSVIYLPWSKETVGGKVITSVPK